MPDAFDYAQVSAQFKSIWTRKKVWVQAGPQQVSSGKFSKFFWPWSVQDLNVMVQFFACVYTMAQCFWLSLHLLCGKNHSSAWCGVLCSSCSSKSQKMGNLTQCAICVVHEKVFVSCATSLFMPWLTHLICSWCIYFIKIKMNQWKIMSSDLRKKLQWQIFIMTDFFRPCPSKWRTITKSNATSGIRIKAVMLYKFLLLHIGSFQKGQTLGHWLKALMT